MCFTSRTKNKTDISLKDRQNEFVNDNMTVCEENCKFIFYDIELKKAECSCSIKEEIPILSEIKINTKLLISNFMDINNFGNFKLIKCFNLLIDKKNIFKNTANYLIIIILIISIVTLFIFLFMDYLKIKNTINKFFVANKTDKNNKITKNNSKSNILLNNYINKENNSNASRIKLRNKTLNKYKNKDQTRNINLNNKEQKQSKMSDGNSLNNNKKIKRKNHKYNSAKNTLNNPDKIWEKEEEKISYTDYEMNILEYEKEIKNDKRTYIQYYISLLKTNHLLFFTFFNNNDYNSKIIKIYIFSLNIAISYTLNAMFYSETIMHKIYIESGKFNFLYQIPEMIYSSLIGSILNAIIRSLGLYQNNILKIKKFKEENIENKRNKIENEIKKIKLKISSFFVISYIFIVFFWIYLGCFCAVYKNTQLHLFKEVLSSIAISFALYFFIYLIPGIFRISSLKRESRPLYKFSKILQLF